MGNYASAYEEYYKNINNKSKDKQFKSGKHFSKNNESNNYMSRADERIKYCTKDYWIKRIERELAGSLVLLSCFMLLKYANVPSINGLYFWCRNAVVSDFNYDESIEAFNSMEIGGYKTKDFRSGSFKIEDLKYENLKTGWDNFKEYLNQLREKNI